MIEHLNDDHLQPWAREQWEKAYTARPRPKASREDLLYGFCSGLLSAHSPESALTEDGVMLLRAVPSVAL